MRLAIVTEWLDTCGGGERVLAHLHAMYPEAPVYTTVHDPSVLPAELHGLDVRTSFIQRLPFVRRSHLAFLPLMPLAFEQIDLGEFDVVLTLNSACAKGVITAPTTANLCYCYTPCRYIWDLYHDYTRNRSWPARAAFGAAAHALRIWDVAAADRVDSFVAISHEVAGRVRKHYRRRARVIYPPVDLERFTVADGPGDYYLVLSRLVPYKRIDLAVRAATRLGRRLVVAGAGPELARLQAMAGPTVEFRGRVSDLEAAELYRGCRALLFPGFEDFGITPVEAQASGRPVIAFHLGGASETVLDGTTGILFQEQTVEALIDAMLSFEREDWDAAECRGNAQRFDSSVFRRRMRWAVEKQFEAVQAGGTEPDRARRAPLPDPVLLLSEPA